MALQIRLNFPTFCSFYSNSSQTRQLERGKKNELIFKHNIHGQVTRLRPIRAHPLSIDFEFISVKEFDVSNFYLLAQWIMDVFKFHGILQDTNPKVVGSTTIRTKQTVHNDKQGVIITISRYVKPKIQ